MKNIKIILKITINNKIDNYFIVIFKKIKNMLIRIDGTMIRINIMDTMVIIKP